MGNNGYDSAQAMKHINQIYNMQNEIEKADRYFRRPSVTYGNYNHND